MSLLNWLSGQVHKNQAEIAEKYAAVEIASINLDWGYARFENDHADEDTIRILSQNLITNIQEYERVVPAKTRAILERETGPSNFRRNEQRVRNYLSR